MYDYRERERLFLAAWKRGVQLAGPGYFKLKAPTGEAATHKGQLEPDWDLIEETLTARSRGEAAFLAAMCSFYNAEWGQSLASKLDEPHTGIIAELFLNYPGW